MREASAEPVITRSPLPAAPSSSGRRWSSAGLAGAYRPCTYVSTTKHLIVCRLTSRQPLARLNPRGSTVRVLSRVPVVCAHRLTRKRPMCILVDTADSELWAVGDFDSTASSLGQVTWPRGLKELVVNSKLDAWGARATHPTTAISK